MYEFDEDFYREPSEFEEKIDELKEALMDSVKDEFKEEMDRLKKENTELQEVKKKMKEIEQEYVNKKRELDWERKDLEVKVRRERLNELMKAFEVELYTIGSKGYKAPKCDKCDEKRRIHYTTPLGRETYETCDCDKRISVYEPLPIMLKSFSINNGKGNAWYEVKDSNSRYEHLSYYEDNIHGEELITSEEQFEDASTWKPLLQTKELAQKFCDYINKGKKG